MNIDRIDVNNHGIGNNSPIDRSSDAAAKHTSRTTSRAGAGEDTVALSNRARRVEQLTNVVAGDRAQRMEQIKAAIENGTYRVSGEEIAQKMIAAHAK